MNKQEKTADVLAMEHLLAKQPKHYYLVNGAIDYALADKFVSMVRSKNENRRENACGLVLTTDGGDPDSGFRMIRALQRYYKSTTLFSFGRCKSTGTLIALGADEIVMSDFGELGPLDIQLAKDDEMINTSGLSYYQSLTSLNDQLFTTFERSFLGIKQRSNHTITTKTAAEIASTLAIGLTSPISAQIDPVKLGEVQRAINIADSYGRRICENHQMVQRLIGAYPSHGFVIDFEEAKEVFPNVRWVNAEERELELAIQDYSRYETSNSIVVFLNELGEPNGGTSSPQGNSLFEIDESVVSDTPSDNGDSMVDTVSDQSGVSQGARTSRNGKRA